MSFIQVMNPAVPPKNIDLADDLLVIRERILQSVLLFTFSFGAVLLIFSFLTGNTYGIPGGMVVISGALIFIATITLLRNLKFSIRAGFYTGFIFILGIISLVTGGLENNGFIILLSYAVLIAVFFRFRSGITSILITAFSAGIISYMMTNGMIPLPPVPQVAASSQLSSWLSMIIRYLFFATISTISMIYLITYLRQSSQDARDTSKALKEERQNMEQIISEKTLQVEKRLTEARTIADITRAISSIVDEDDLLRKVVDLVQQRLGMYYVGLFTVDDFEINAVLRAGSGEAGQKMLAAKHQLAVGGASMIGTAIQTKTARIALDASGERVRFNNPILPNTRSELALPIIIRDRSVGAMTIQSDQPNAFDQDDILIFQSITDGLAVALENARLFRRSQEDLVEIRALNKKFVQTHWLSGTSSSNNSIELTFPGATNPDLEPSLVNIPISLRDQPIGVLELELDRAELTDEEERLIEAITTQTALALENARLLDESQKRALREEGINQISANMTRAMNIDDLLKTTIAEISRLPTVNEVAIHLVSDDQH